MLYGTSPTDAVTFVAVAVILLVSSLVAALVPARRATLVDPVEALRRD
jgi:ABC-type lipoprotein release transport system permease subunit